jgi:thioredoxin 1
MKPEKKKKLISFAILIAAVVGVIEIENLNKRNAAPCESGLCKHTPGLADAINGPKNPATDQTSPLPQLIDFGAGKCATCKMMTGVLDELAVETADQLSIRFVDTHKDPTTTEAYSIRIIPTQVFLDAEGNELFRHEGYISKEDILKKWSELGIQLQSPEKI